MKSYPFGINGNAEGRVERGGDGGVGGVLGAESDEPDAVALAIDVDADAGDAAVYLEAGLEVEDGAVGREADDEDGGGGGRLGGFR